MKHKELVVFICIGWLILSLISPMMFIGQKIGDSVKYFLMYNLALSFICTIFFAFVIPDKEPTE